MHDPDVEIKVGDFHLSEEAVLLFDENGRELDSEVIPVAERYNDPQGLNRVRINVLPSPTLESDNE